MTFPHENPVEPESVNVDGRLLKQVVDRFKGQQSSGLFPGGQLVLRRNGKTVGRPSGVPAGYGEQFLYVSVAFGSPE